MLAPPPQLVSWGRLRPLDAFVMKRGTTRDSSSDAALRELERALDAFMATHVATAANALATMATKNGVEDVGDLNKPFVDEDDAGDVAVEAATNSVQKEVSTDMANFHRDLKRLQCLSSVITSTRRRRGPSSIVGIVRLLLTWLQAVESSSAAAAASSSAVVGGALPPPSAAEAARAAELVQQQSPIDPVASWLVATLLRIAFRAPQTPSNVEISSNERAAVDELVALTAARCFLAFQRAWQADEETQRRARAESSGTLFSYLTMRKAKPKSQSSSGPANALAVCLSCTTEAGIVWGHVLGLAVCLAPDVSRMKLQNEILARAAVWNATKPSTGSGDIAQHPYLKHLSHIRLGVAPSQAVPNATLSSRMSGAARWLRVVMPLLLKPHRSHVRSACAHLISQMLIRELDSLDRLELSVLYTSTGSDWSRCISDLHAAALRLTDCAKKKGRGRAQQHLEASSWSLRAVALALAPGEIFTRYWNDDTLALLRLQQQLNQDSSAGGAATYNVLPSLELSFTYMMHRHFLLRDSGAAKTGAPTSSDCEGTINTTQAWVFFSLQRLRPQTPSSASISSFTALKTITLPALVRVSRAIASYNMACTVQNHIRPLLSEPVRVGDPQMLIGLEALADLLSRNDRDDKTRLSFRVNNSDLLASRQMIGELVGRVLLACSTQIGHKLLTEVPAATKNRDTLQLGELGHNNGDDDEEEHWKDPTQAVAVATFAAALALMSPLYAHLALSNEQKLRLLVRTSINAELAVHRRAHEALLALIGPQSPHSTEPPPPGAGMVVRELTDHIMRMNANNPVAVSDAAGAIVILRLLSDLLEPSRATMTRWESPQDRYAALIQVEAIAIYLLVRGDDNIEAEQSLRVTALETLEVAHEARVACCEQPAVRSSVQLPLVGRPSVWTLLGDLDSDLKTAFFSFGPETAEDTRPDQPVDKHSAFRHLILDTTDRHSFRWSLCLARVFRSLARRAPDVIAYIWTDVVDKVAKLEPVLSVTPVPGDALQQNQLELARWRNLALLATVSACPILQSPTRKTELSSFCSENASSCPSEPPSVAPSAMVATLVRQLACYLRSTNVGHRNAAVLALGHAGSVALPTLLEVLARLEGEVFTAPSSNGEQDAPDGNSLTTSTLQRIRSPRPAKLPKKKLLELQHARIAQFSLQWAVGRCYRILLESRTREHDDNEELEPGSPVTERLRRAVSAFLAKMTTTFEDATNSSVDSEASDGSLSFNSSVQVLDENPVLLMVQLDFIALLRALLLHSNAAVKPVVQLPHDKLAALLLSWSGSFDKDLAGAAVTGYLHAGFVAPETGCELYSHWMKQCDVHTARDGKLVFPWIWIDSQHQLLGTGGSTTEACMASRSVVQYFICHRAFSTLTELLRSSLKSADGTGTWDGDSVATWLDACFSVDGVAFSHFNDLHQLAQGALHVLLELPPGTARFNHVVKRCLEKATYPFSSADKSALRVARQYLEALGASNEVISFFRSLLLRLQERRGNTKDGEETYLAVRLLHVLLLHVGVQLDDKLVHQHRQVALDMAAALVCEPDANCDDDESAATRWSLQGYYSPALEGLVAGRLQVSVSALLASRFSVLSLRVSLAVLRSMPDSTLQDRDDIAQQRQMLAAVLPWLAEVPLWTPNEPSNRSAELLDLLFGLTTALGGTCGEQLDHIWLTLAFASTGGDDTNLGEIVNFLFRQQRKSQLPSETAKTVMWWLCRWQDAAPDVLRLLLLQLPLMAAKEPDPSEVATALNELAALVTLAGDTSCHLLQAGASTSNADVRALAVHLVHIALTTLFALLESDSVDEIASNSITQHCHVLLHSVLPLLEAPRSLLAAALALIKASTSRINIDERNTQSSSRVQREEFLEALRALAVCLSATETQTWSELCVQEIAMTISLETSSTSESLETRRRPSPPHEVCIRFALVAYTQLSPRFQGDVLLSILTLLRQTLTAGVEDTRQSRPSSLARECLALLAMLIRSMPVSRLVLYPQVFWVALALLTHCRQQRDNTPSSSPSLHAGALGVLSILWDRTPFSSHPVVQDVIRGTRPAQWESTTARNSVLMEIVRCVYSDEGFDSRTRALEMLRKAVLLVPRDLLGVSAREHLVICTLALLPALIIPSSEANNSRQEANSDFYTRDDLVVLWQTAGTPDQLVGLLQMRGEFTLSGRDSARKLAATFMAAYVPAMYSLEHEDNGVEFDGLKLSLEVLVACLPQPAGPQTRESSRLESSGAELNDERCNFVFVLLEELLRDVFRRKQSTWRPVPELEAALARLLRSPQTERQWRASVRVLSWVAELAKVTGTTGSSVSPLPVPSTARRSLPGGKSSEMITSLGRIAESEDDIPPGHSSAYLGSPTAAGDANTLKKTPSTRALQRFASPRSRSSGSISRNSRNTGGNNNNELPRSSEPPSMKKQHLSEQSGSEHEAHTLSGDGQPTADA